MKGTNSIRLVLCGFVSGVVFNLVSVVFLSLFAPDFVASVQRNAPHPPLGGEFFFAVDLAMGIWAVCSAAWTSRESHDKTDTRVPTPG